MAKIKIRIKKPRSLDRVGRNRAQIQAHAKHGTAFEPGCFQGISIRENLCNSRKSLPSHPCLSVFIRG